MPTVDEWLDATANPNVDVIRAVVEVLRTDERLDEAVKYRAPAFVHGTSIVCYVNWSAKAFTSLIFPSGSKLPGEYDRLEGDGVQRMMRLHDLAEVEAARDELLDIVDDWIEFVAG